MTRIGLLALKTAEKADYNFPDLSSPEAAKNSLATALQDQKINDGAPEGSWASDIFIHPSSGKPFIPNERLSKANFPREPTNTILFYAPEPDGDERIVLYADGHSEWVRETDWGVKKLAGGAK